NPFMCSIVFIASCSPPGARLAGGSRSRVPTSVRSRSRSRSGPGTSPSCAPSRPCPVPASPSPLPPVVFHDGSQDLAHDLPCQDDCADVEQPRCPALVQVVACAFDEQHQPHHEQQRKDHSSSSHA